MIRVYTAIRRENLDIAFDPKTGVYDKNKITDKSRCPDSIYVYRDISGLNNETLSLLYQAVLFDIMAGHPGVILSGMVDESQVYSDDHLNPISKRIGLTLTVDKVFSLDDSLEDITDQVLR